MGSVDLDTLVSAGKIAAIVFKAVPVIVAAVIDIIGVLN
jgi:hypothetical protein